MSLDFINYNKPHIHELSPIDKKENALPLSNQITFFFSKTTPTKIVHIGNWSEFLADPKAKLGFGFAKTVMLMTAQKIDKKGFRDVAHSLQSGNKTGQEVELRVLKVLSEDPEAKDLSPKIYYAGTDGNQLETVTKRVSGGDARHCLPHMPISDRLRAISTYGNGLQLLHKHSIIHNDTALRNMLIEWPNEKINIEKALNFRLAKPIFDVTGKTLFEAKEKITPEIQEKLKALNITQVKVFVNQPPKGVITDFDRCTFSGDLTSKVLLGCALDCTAPERMLASNQYKKLKDSTSKEGLLLASTVKSDAFSFGQLLCDAILRPDLNTNLAEKSEYNNISEKRINERIKEYEAKSKLSAIDPQDYLALYNINPELAKIASKLMSYQPDMRPNIEEALVVLEKVIARFPPRDQTYAIYDHAFKSFDEAKNPKPAYNMFANTSNEPTDVPFEPSAYGNED